jgi:hypothetical protein
MTYESESTRIILIFFFNLTFNFQDHRERVSTIHGAVGVSLSKVTHATRSYTAITARENGASVDGTKALGGWSEGGCFRPCYDRALPVDALLGAATFNARRPESYSLPRNALGE